MDDMLLDGKYKFLEDWAPYDNEIIRLMYDVKFYGMPVSFLLLDSRKTVTHCHFLCKSIKCCYSRICTDKGKKERARRRRTFLG